MPKVNILSLLLSSQGVAIQNRKCAMCRADIPLDYLDHPILLEKLSPQVNTDNVQVEYQWYYEGRNGNLLMYLQH